MEKKMLRILVIDDEEAMRSYLQRALQQANFDVEVARDGAEGLKLFGETVADLVITDIFMPKCDGLETIRGLRKLSPKLKIIAMSGGYPPLGAFPALDIASSLGADYTLEKPFRFKALLAVIQGMCSDTPSQTDNLAH